MYCCLAQDYLPRTAIESFLKVKKGYYTFHPSLNKDFCRKAGRILKCSPMSSSLFSFLLHILSTYNSLFLLIFS